MKRVHKIGGGMQLFIFVVLSAQWSWGQAASPAGQTGAGGAQNPSQEIQTQTIESPAAHPQQPATLGDMTGSLKAEEVKDLLKKVRFSEYRINDLLTDVHPEKWNLPEGTLASFRQSLKSLHDRVDALEQWRAQFEQRTDSLYLGFQTYSTIDAVLPRLNGVTQNVGEHETAEYAAQFSRAGDRLFDLQQSIGQYVSSLMKSQDQVLMDYSSNMASCQQSLTEAMRGQGARPKYMRNSSPTRPQRRSARSTPARQGGNEKQRPQENKPPEKKPAPSASGAPQKL